MCDSCKQNNFNFKSAIIVFLIIMAIAALYAAHILFIMSLL